ncbi:MAG TPA: hypothetical protein DIW30_03675 [Bacteroidales bacterium]|nr:hypothetical protein [Bacteroidales bacterium]
MRKFYLLLSAVLLTGYAWAAVTDTIQADGVYYQLDRDARTAAVIRPNTDFVYNQDTIIIPVSVVNDGSTFDVTSIARAAFSKATCQAIVFAEGSKVTEIGQQAFQGAMELRELALPEGVRYLPVTAIHGVGSSANMQLHKVTLPSTMDSLDVMSIQVAALDSIVCKAVTPPHCSLTTGSQKKPCLPFTSNNSPVFVPKGTKVIVPEGSEKLYRAEAGWDYFDCFADNGTDTLRSGVLYYTIEGGKAVVMPDITGGSYKDEESVTIPTHVSKTVCTITAGRTNITAKEIPVTGLGKGAFRGNKSIHSLTFATPSNIENIQPMAMMQMEGMTGTLELPEGLKHIATSGIHSGVSGGQMPVKKLIMPSTLDSLDVISVILNELETLAFRGETAPKCQVKQLSTQKQIPWAINLTSNRFPTPANVEIIIPDGTYNSYKNQAGIGDYFEYFINRETSQPDVMSESKTSRATGIYNLLGVYLGTDESNLPHGIYIINGKKAVR